MLWDNREIEHRIGCLDSLDLVVADPLVSVTYSLGMLVDSPCICPISGILLRNAVLVESLEICDGGFSSYSGLSLIIKSYSSFHLSFFCICSFLGMFPLEHMVQ
jgi:hypothetical protein